MKLVKRTSCYKERTILERERERVLKNYKNVIRLKFQIIKNWKQFKKKEEEIWNFAYEIILKLLLK